MKKTALNRWHDCLCLLILIVLLVGCGSDAPVVGSIATVPATPLPTSTSQPQSIAVTQPTTAAATEAATSAAAQSEAAQVLPSATPTERPTVISAEPTAAQPIILATRTPSVEQPPILTPVVDSFAPDAVVGSNKWHKLRWGETLSQVASDYEVPVQAIIELNNIENPSYVVAGRALHIPLKLDAYGIPVPTPTQIPYDLRVHVLGWGETLSEVAQQYNVPIEALMEVNEIRRASYVVAGTRLRIPHENGAQAEAATSLNLAASSSDGAQANATPVPAAVTPVATAPSVPEQEQESSGSGLVLDINADSNLYLLVDSKLIRWNAPDQTWQPVFLGEDNSRILSYHMSDDEAVILVERSHTTSRATTYDMALMDSDGAIRAVIDQSSNKYVDSYLTTDGETAMFIRPAIGSTAEIVAVNIDAPSEATVVGLCQQTNDSDGNVRPCAGLFAATNNNSVLYGDGSGLWHAVFDGSAPTQLIDLQAHPEVNQFEPIGWSPSEQFLLVKGHTNLGSVRFVLDVDSAELHELPENADVSGVSSVSWMTNDNIVVIEPSDPTNSVKPVMTIHAINPDSSRFFSIEERAFLTTVPNHDAGDGSENRAIAPLYLSNDVVEFALRSTDENEQGVYQLELDSMLVSQVSSWPALSSNFVSAEMHWTPDNSGLLAVHEDNSGSSVVYFMANTDEPPVRMPFDSDLNYCCYMWR